MAGEAGFAVVRLVDSPLLASLDPTSVRAVYASFVVVVILAFDQLLHVLWFVRLYVVHVALRVVKIMLGLVLLGYAQCLRLSRSKRGRRRQAKWSVRARNMLRRRDRFSRAKKQDRSSSPREDRLPSGKKRDRSPTPRRRRSVRSRWAPTLHRRPLLRFLMSLPAVALLLLAGFDQLRWTQTSHQGLTPRYQRAAEAAYDQEDFAAADLYFRRLREFGSSSVQSIYKQALVAQRQGDPARAKNLMEAIAPTDAAGYPQAHLWLAKSLVEGRSAVDPETANAYYRHLSHAVEGDPSNQEAHALLGILLHEAQRHAGAIPHLEFCRQQRPDLRLALARSYAGQQKLDEAKAAGQQAVDYYTQLARDEPGKAEHRIRWASALVFLIRFEDARDVLEEGLAGEHADQFRSALVHTYVSWFEFASSQEDRDEELLVEIGRRGLAVAPDNVQLLKGVSVLAVFGKTTKDQRERLRPLLVRARSSPDVLATLGSEYISRKDFDRAVERLERAHQLAPKSAEIQNNLAWSLIFASEPQLDRALELSNKALRQHPDNPHLLDTRGHILVKLGRYEEALADLEKALASKGGNPKLHQALATVYAKLGIPEIAAIHERLAKPPDNSPNGQSD